MRAFLLLFVLQFAFYLVVTIDYRAVSTKKYGAVVATNMVLPALAYGLTRVIATTDAGWTGVVAVSIAGAASAVLGVWLTEHWG